MLLKIFNRALINDREKTYLTVAVSATGTALTVASTDIVPAGTSSDTWADNDYMIVGEIGSETAEIMQMAAAVTTSNTLTIDRSGSAGGLRNAHAIGEPVYRIDFNRVEFSRNTTNTSVGVTVLTTIRIQPDDEFTRYQDTVNTTGYGFARFNNETSSAFSSYSDGVNYEASGESSSYDPRTLWSIRRKVRTNLDEDRPSSKLTDRQIDETVNDKQRDIAHQRLWSFYEYERTLSSVADQFAYDLPATVQKVHTVSFDTQPLLPISRTQWDIIHFDSNQTTTDPSYFNIWNRQLKVWPRPSASASTTTLGAAITTVTATTITVVATSAFNRGDYYRFIIDSEVIYATDSTSTTFTGCLRGQEGTTAATHLINATVTERDITYTAHVEPTDLTDAYDRTTIPEPEVLVWGVSADLAISLNKPEVHDRLLSKYEKGIKELENKYALKQSAIFKRVKMSEEVVTERLTNPNYFPKDLG